MESPPPTASSKTFGDSPGMNSDPFPSHRITDKHSLSQLYERPFDEHCVLSFDGGGIRGYSSLIIIKHLMEKVREVELQEHNHHDTSFAPVEFTPCIRKGVRRSSTSPDLSQETCGDCCRYLPCHYFDFIGGTSTGGLISIMLGRLRMSVQSCLDEYEILAKDVFGSPRKVCLKGPIIWPREKYNENNLQQAVEKVVASRMSKDQRQVGAGNFKSPPGLCRTVVFAYADKISGNTVEYMDAEASTQQVDKESGVPYLFRSYDHWGSNADEPISAVLRNPGPAQSLPIWQVARATTAAPLYFKPIKIANRRFGDGGFGTNNPALEMYYEVNAMNGGDNGCIKALISIGTGEIPFRRYGDGFLAKYITLIRALRKLATDSATVHQVLSDMKKAWRFPYYRFNVESSPLGMIKLDEIKEDTLRKIARITNEYCQTPAVDKELMEAAKILVRQRKKRAGEALWPLVSTGTQYRCTYEKCHRSQELVPNKDDLCAHLESVHEQNAADHATWVRRGSVTL